MKRTYGNIVERLLWGGTTLTEVEYQLLQHSVQALPQQLRSVVEAQFDAYNLVQREIDGRALNFYRKKGGRANHMEGLPLLPMAVDEAPLVRLTVTFAEEVEPLHATLAAVDGRVFCVALSRPARSKGTMTVSRVKKAWRSNFRFGAAES